MSDDGPCNLPSELWRQIIYFATCHNRSGSSSREYAVSNSHPSDSIPCLKSDTPETPILYHNRLKNASGQSPSAFFSELKTKWALSLTCRSFNNLVAEYLFDRISLLNVASAERIADALESSTVYDNPGRWVRHITVIGVYFSPPDSSGALANATLRILAKAQHLTSFHLVWNSMTRELREYEEQLISCIPPQSLRHFEWQSTGAGFERQPRHKFFTLLRRASPTLRVLKIGGYLPLAEEVYDTDAGDDALSQPLEPVVLPQLTHLKVRRAFRDDLKLISPWNMSSSLTCLTLSSIWTYFDNREVTDKFWQHFRPTLRCLHLGEGTALCVSMARKLLVQCTHLKELEYYYLGDWDEQTWQEVSHEHLESVLVHISHPMIALRSFFNSRRFTREQQWGKLARHISPFLGRHVGSAEIVEDETNRPSNIHTSTSRANLVNSNYPAMKKLSLIEYSRKFEELNYDPPELAAWLQNETRKIQEKTVVEIAVAVADYIR